MARWSSATHFADVYTLKLKKHLPRTEFGDFWQEGNPVDVHELLGNAWWAWLAWVLTLEQAARYIGERARYKAAERQVVMPMVLCVRAMLLGYAIECSLKGLWVRQGNRIIENGRYVGIPGVPDHDLLRLATAVGFSPTAAERDVLQHLTKFIRFAGRYPVAKTADANLPKRQQNGPAIDIAYFSKQDFRRCITILNKVARQASGKTRPLIVKFAPTNPAARQQAGHTQEGLTRNKLRARKMQRHVNR